MHESFRKCLGSQGVAETAKDARNGGSDPLLLSNNGGCFGKRNREERHSTGDVHVNDPFAIILRGEGGTKNSVSCPGDQGRMPCRT